MDSRSWPNLLLLLVVTISQYLSRKRAIERYIWFTPQMYFFNFFADVANDVYLLWNLVLAKIWNDLIYVFNHPSIHPIFQKRNRSTETFRKEAYCFECGARFCWTQRPATQLNFVNDRLFLLYFVVHFTLSLQNSNTTRKSKV